MSFIVRTIASIHAALTGGGADRSPSNDPSGQHRRDAAVPSPQRKPDGAEPPRMDNASFWLAAIADSSDDAIVGKDLDGHVTSWNKAAERMFGYTAREIIGQPITRIIPTDRIDQETSILAQVRRSEKIVHFETRRQCKNGMINPVSLAVLPVRDDLGRIIGVSETARDLTQAQRTHRDLERREALLRSILETVPDAVIVIDKQGLIHSFSLAAVRLFGYASAEMMGQNIDILLPASNWDQHNSTLGGYSETGERHTIGFGHRKDGSSFPMELSIGKVDVQGSRLFTAFVHDLTDQVKRERELRAANTELERLARHLVTARDTADRSNWAKSRFLAGMSHELRTPLNGILGYAELLRREGGLNAIQGGRVDAMVAAARHLLQMITAVLDLSEIEAEHLELQAVDVDVLVVANACLDVVRPAARAKRLALSMSVTPGTRHELVTDPMRLRQILMNLLGNAVKFTSEGSVAVCLRPLGDGSILRIEVADTGPGIPARERRRLFQDFERINLAATRPAEGAGLGLALSSRLATLLGGSLGHRDNPGGGSVFWLEMPLGTPAAPQHAAPRELTLEAAAHTVLHVLLVDDIAMNRDVAGSFLRAAGHKVTCVDGGAQAVAMAGTTDFDVVLMDVRMPEMDGLEATRLIRALPGERGRVPIVALTALAFSEQVAECQQAGMDGHLAKPFDPDSLLAAVLRAAATRLTADKAPASAMARQPVVVPVIGSDLLVFNMAAYERTAFYLPPEAVASYLEAIAEQGEVLLCGLAEPNALVRRGEELAEAAHALAGSAGMFGFERLTAVGRRFERAVHAGAAEAPALADGLTAALKVTLQALHDRTAVTVD